MFAIRVKEVANRGDGIMQGGGVWNGNKWWRKCVEKKIRRMAGAFSLLEKRKRGIPLSSSSHHCAFSSVQGSLSAVAVRDFRNPRRSALLLAVPGDPVI